MSSHSFFRLIARLLFGQLALGKVSEPLSLVLVSSRSSWAVNRNRAALSAILTLNWGARCHSDSNTRSLLLEAGVEMAGQCRGASEPVWQQLIELRCRKEVIERWLSDIELPLSLQESLRERLCAVESEQRMLDPYYNKRTLSRVAMSQSGESESRVANLGS